MDYNITFISVKKSPQTIEQKKNNAIIKSNK